MDAYERERFLLELQSLRAQILSIRKHVEYLPGLLIQIAAIERKLIPPREI